jgi:hypothetical protein
MSGSTETSHGPRCVCSSCLGLDLNRQLAEARTRHGLSAEQRRYLDAFTRAWNKDRAARGLAPMLADDALTQVLKSASELVK